jgi:hypothetical protein
LRKFFTMNYKVFLGICLLMISTFITPEALQAQPRGHHRVSTHHRTTNHVRQRIKRAQRAKRHHIRMAHRKARIAKRLAVRTHRRHHQRNRR